MLQHDDEALRARTYVIECLTEYVKSARQRPRPPASRQAIVSAGSAELADRRPLESPASAVVRRPMVGRAMENES